MTVKKAGSSDTGGMCTTETRGRVRRVLLLKGKSERAVVQDFGIEREPGRKPLRYSVPPSKRKVKRPKMWPSSPRTYAEEVVIGKSLSLVGSWRDKTIIDATGRAAGMYVDGLDNPSLKDVVGRNSRSRTSTSRACLWPMRPP